MVHGDLGTDILYLIFFFRCTQIRKIDDIMSILHDIDEDLTHPEYNKAQFNKVLEIQREERLSGKQKEELLVFGYECKLFNDPAAAKAVNDGLFLIPWMGDRDLMIDR